MQALLFENFPFGIVMCFVATLTMAFRRHSWFTTITKWERVQRNTAISYVSRIRVIFMSLDSNKINLKNESYLCNRMFARAK